MPTLPPVGEMSAVLMPMTLPFEVEHRAARIAHVDRRVGLDVAVVDAGVEVAVERRDDSGGDGSAEAERIADRHHPVADPDRLRIAEADERQIVALDLEHGEVGRGVAPDQGRLELAAVRQGHGDLLDRGAGPRRRDDVVVGDDVAVGRDDEARAERAAALGDRRVAAAVGDRNPELAEEILEAGGDLAVAVDLQHLLGRDVDHGRLELRGEVGEAHRSSGARSGGGDGAGLVLRGLGADGAHRQRGGGAAQENGGRKAIDVTHDSHLLTCFRPGRADPGLLYRLQLYLVRLNRI